MTPGVTVEVLIPDLKGKEELMDIIYDEKPDVLNHNIEVVPELYDEIMPGSNFERSLKVLDYAKKKRSCNKDWNYGWTWRNRRTNDKYL